MKNFFESVNRIEEQEKHFKRQPIKLSDETITKLLHQFKSGRMPKESWAIDIYEKLKEGGLL
jgi:hypothetical protein